MSINSTLYYYHSNTEGFLCFLIFLCFVPVSKFILPQFFFYHSVSFVLFCRPFSPFISVMQICIDDSVDFRWNIFVSGTGICRAPSCPEIPDIPEILKLS